MDSARSLSFGSSETFSYNKRHKLILNVSLLLIGFFLLTSMLFLVVFLRDSENVLIVFLFGIVSSIYEAIKSGSLLGAFYTTAVGGLFFLIVPIEAFFFNFMRSGHNFFLLIFIYLLGLSLSYTVNYYIGFYLNDFSKRLISPKKFYKIKSVINRYGAFAIFFFNVLPLPSQALSTILGVFKYNKVRFYFFFLLGQLIKYSLISLAYLFIFKPS